jgi:ATP-binding cassette subfamily B protein
MLRYLNPYMLRFKVRLAFGFLVITLANLFGIVAPSIVKEVIDYLKTDIVLAELYAFAGWILFFTFISGFFRFLMRRTINVASRYIENDIRNDLFKKLQSLDIRWYQKNNTGDIMSILTNDLNAIRSVLGPAVMYTVNLITTFVFVTTMMINISPLMTIIALLPVPIMALVVQKTGSAIHKRFLAVQEQFALISTKAQENLSGIRIIKSYVLEKTEQTGFNKLNREYIDKNMAYARVEAAFQPSMMLIVGIGSALILLFGGELIISNVISLGEFVAFMLYLGMLIWPSIALGWVTGLFLRGTAAHKRLQNILNAKPEISDDDSKEPVEINGDISINQLQFTYPSTEKHVLEIENLRIEAGQIVAIVGKTGAGKSTIMHLLTREFDCPPGSIFIDGEDIRSLGVNILRSHIGYIPQDTFLFSDTIRNNISYGVNNIAQDEIEWAARAADIHDMILDLPNGYDTMLGERGINISGGQKQRLAIARAIVKHPRILLLDDALSAVDTLTEERILNNLRSVMKDKTCFWVSHRISSIKEADKILVIDSGQIAEEGQHEDLILKNGIYASLFEKQKLEESLELVD